MFYVEKLNYYQRDIVGLAEEIQQHRNHDDMDAAARLEKVLLTKLENWKKLLESFYIFSLIGSYQYQNSIETVDTAIKFIKHNNLIVSNCIRVAVDIKEFKELI